jgi:hypothetical protein
MRAPTASRVLSLSLGLLLSLAACKDKLEDLPDVDPVDDPWVDEIENEEVAAVDGAAVPTADPAAGTLPSTPEPTPAPGEPTLIAEADPTAAGTPDPATAEAAKLGGATVPSSKPKAGPATPESPKAPSDAAVDPVAPPVEPAPVDPTPAVDPTPKPAAEPAKPAAPPPITMADFGGTFRFSGGGSQEQALAEAIEFGANQVASIIRGVARKRLTKTQIIEDPVTITITGDSAKFHWGTTGEGMTCQIDGPTTTMSYKGDKYKARCRSKDGKLITSFQAPDATKTIVYTLSSDRKSLTAHHKLVADQLQEPVTFKLSYTRK